VIDRLGETVARMPTWYQVGDRPEYPREAAGVSVALVYAWIAEALPHYRMVATWPEMRGPACCG